ncbi:fatty acid hydroxylase [Loktanella sp. F6476L]|uniref:sterol desaturase family protein n=1 Tax=Loktanella sp. F6476L TaxID=2926405 RepID=UPI001FF4F459|nr:sterol desaturase family protein [Loktanella sp. F6476L]MCK0121266.1 fatty acid hydroxylase [Loktanella sp. F6476L]
MARLKIMFSHLSVVLMALAAAVGIVVLVSAPWWVWLLVPLGIGAQMLNEYNLHRYVFHLPPPKRQWVFDLLYQAHYGHHDFPTNHGLFFVPVWVALPVLAFNFGLVWGVAAIIGLPFAFEIAVAIVVVGEVLTFLGYEWFHMTSHLNIPKTRVERYVTTLHNQHHFRDFSKWFHVSPGGEVIDRAMGTAIDRDTLRSQQRIEFIRTLGLRPDDPRLVSARQRFAPKYGLTSAEVARAAAV